ncbi:MAG: ATP-dependent DNA helicase [Elusimicrobiaceae bacterium]
MSPIFPGDSTNFETEIRAILSEGGLAGGMLPGFEPRSAQIEMGAAVARSLNSGAKLIAQAGTGVGKSLAYLIPAAFWACDNEKKVIVATYTRALQEQLINKDLPVVAKLAARTGRELNYALLMGAENYLCARRLAHAASAQRELFDSPAAGKILGHLADFARQSETGLRSAIPFSVPAQVWEKVRREADLCLKKRCPFRERCLYMKDIFRACKADVLVVNQHLFFAGLPVSAYHAVIFDEAHNMEDTAAEFLGFSVSNYRVGRMLSELYTPAGGGRGLVKRIKNKPAAWLEEFEKLVLETGKAADNFFLSCARAAGLKITAVLAEAKSTRILRPDIAEDNVTALLTDLARQLGAALEDCSNAEDEVALSAYKNRVLETVADIRAFLKAQGNDKAYWIESRLFRSAPAVELNMTLLDVSEELGKSLFSRPIPVILTSATLAVEGNFENLKTGLGIGEAQEIIFPSPFDYRSNAAFYTAANLPDPGAQPADFEKEACAKCLEIIKVIPGGVFILFTSWEFLRKASNYINSGNTGRDVFVQGTLLADELLRSFRESGNGVLLATDTFWQGVDVPGSNLACVIITKLPFASPGSPVESARSEYLTMKGKNVFEAHSLPKAVIKFHQGFGRLIRKTSDYGAVAVLDPRIITRRYGAKFVNSVPECTYVSDLTNLAAFFKDRGGRPRPAIQANAQLQAFEALAPNDDDFRCAQFDVPQSWSDTPFE